MRGKNTFMGGPIREVPYKKQCIQEQKACSSEEQTAAVLDYNGALYGEPGKVQFDGKLTPEERAYLEEKFGKIPQGAGLVRYFADAREQFLSSFQTKRNCELGTKKAENKKYGRGEFLGNYHGCTSDYISAFENSGLRDEMVSNPNEWIIFLEGSDVPQKFQEKAPETIYFNRVGKALGIPIYDPVITLWRQEVLDILPKRVGFDKYDFAAAEAYLTMLKIFKLFSDTDTLISTLVQIEQALLTAYNVPIETATLQKAIEKFIFPPDGNGPLELSVRQRQLAHARLEQVAGVSNDLSAELAKKILTESGRRKALYVMGSGHLPMSDIIYHP